MDAVKDTHAIIILTEWEEFNDIDFKYLFSKMYKPSWIFDTRSIIDVEKAEKVGFNVWQVGNYSKDA